MTTDQIKNLHSMRDIILRYDLQLNRSGFINCPFHIERTASMKIYDRSYYCFGCGANGDIFSFIMRMDNISFKEAFNLLGGKHPSGYNLISAKDMKSGTVVTSRKINKIKEQKAEQEYQRNNLLISVYRRYLNRSEPLSELWCSCYNALQYQIYLSEYLDNKK